MGSYINVFAIMNIEHLKAVWFEETYADMLYKFWKDRRFKAYECFSKN